MPMTTILDVAKLAEVSTATVSHVINNTRKVNTETRARVEKAIKELHFHPSQQARGLKTGQSQLIGVLNYYSRDAYFSEVLSSIERNAENAGYDVLLRHSEPDGGKQALALGSWINKNLDGLIINSPFVSDEFMQLIQRLDCPCVLLHVDIPDCQCDTIQVDDLEISKSAVDYLIQLGHRQIACISGFTQNFHTASRRHLGYEMSLNAAGIPMLEEYTVVTDYQMEEGYQACKELMKLPNPPTAIFTYSDLLAIGVIRATNDLGLSVPANLSVIGFDDIETSSFITPRLTTIIQDKEAIGEMAVNLILKRIQTPDLTPEKVMLPTRLVIRESTRAL